ncbi:GyrI-like domain-containing protein [Enterococcus xiangfangensis]|uniref:GyrI-like domain-containing protein n=1 Tax=Enterococcus xiangfangensis TaxID=1296537 RepID=UPI0010F57A9E|nr:GyrI-like domain-containing protein [Enterococcus xiangfangensis]MBM7711169.1 putative transcriptional regulator YdeE [Enterococcus xiangfangensis]NBK09231.1 AraC family transcriptional regulator [Enterococcus asini]
MKNYTLEEKESFIVLGIGTELKSDYTDFAGINREKSTFWQTLEQNGKLKSLKAVAANDYIFAVNEAVNNKMMYYAGVMTDVTLSEESRVIQFPQGDYLVVKGEGATVDELNNTLAGIAFGQVLPTVTDFAYVGGPNATVMMGEQNGSVVGEMWIPVVKK